MDYDDTQTSVYYRERIIHDDIGVIDEEGIYDYDLFFYSS
jgi:hypothetical protein